MKKLYWLFCVILLCSCATTVPTGKAGSAAAAKPAGSKVVCHVERVNSSTMLKRVCRTPEQQKADEEMANRIIDKVRNTPPSIGGM